MLFWGITFGFAGKVLLATSVILVHSKITKEKHIDGLVLMEMRRERNLAFLGIIFMAIGFLLELAAFGLLPGIIASAHAGL
jgi:hypothetical protein